MLNGDYADAMSAPDPEFPGYERLNELDLPMLLETDGWLPAPPDSFMDFFDPEGKPIPGDIVEPARAFEVFRHNGENHFLDSLWWNNIPIEVSTVYLGINTGISFFRDRPPQPPIIWETMIFPGLDRWDTWCMRYCTRAAAKAAHEKILATLLEMGFTRADGETVTIEGETR